MSSNGWKKIQAYSSRMVLLGAPFTSRERARRVDRVYGLVRTHAHLDDIIGG